MDVNGRIDKGIQRRRGKNTGLSCTGSAATATLPVHAGENLGVIKYERWKRRQGSIVAPMATKPTLPDGMCLPTGKPA